MKIKTKEEILTQHCETGHETGHTFLDFKELDCIDGRASHVFAAMQAYADQEKKRFADDLRARIEIKSDHKDFVEFYKHEIFQIIDKTLNAKHPTPEQIEQIQKEE